MTTGDLAKSYASIGRIIDRFEDRTWRLHVREHPCERTREQLVAQLVAFRDLLHAQLVLREADPPRKRRRASAKSPRREDVGGGSGAEAFRDPIDDVLESMLRNCESENDH